jgi:hypothetical protein
MRVFRTRVTLLLTYMAVMLFRTFYQVAGRPGTSWFLSGCLEVNTEKTKNAFLEKHLSIQSSKSLIPQFNSVEILAFQKHY